MMLFKAFSSSMRLLLLIPFLGAMGYGLFMTKFMNEAQNGELGFAGRILMEVGRVAIEHRADSQRDAVFDMAGLSTDRVVRLERRVPVAELLGEGDLPQGAALTLAVQARGKQLAEADCPLLLATLAQSCALRELTVRMADREGIVIVEASLAFTPADPAGDIEGVEGRDMHSREVKLLGGNTRPVAATDLAARRSAALTEAAAACAEVRKTEGNCVVRSVSLSERPRDDGRYDVRAEARLAVLAPLPKPPTS
ncbi:hypothetical protein [Rhodobacter ferrooxidans]|uniref:Uncharacterized protein n=1 Tax=Rhodobacter ferrooxidans TaxID=371731 RepID=C8RW49_9RHOB|nr:hypothetical protein [Rhodobacter sp. SW2]EEW26792.1 hypothetical protein Rsw2DRAFT_0027 [Rhodobacter sp. SW2]